MFTIRQPLERTVTKASSSARQGEAPASDSPVLSALPVVPKACETGRGRATVMLRASS